MLDRYAEQPAAATSRQIDYYIAFGYWKLACIVEGVYARYVGGAMGSNDPKAFEGFKIRSSAAPSTPPRPWGGSDEASRP